MPPGRAPPGLSLVCLNVQGLTGPKLVHLLSWLKEKRVDAAVLTETRCTSSPEDLLRRQPGAGVLLPGARFFHVPGTGHTEGVCVVLGPSLAHSTPQQHAVAVPGPGRAIRVDLHLHQQLVSLVGVYAPAQPADRPGFYADQLRALLPSDGRPVLLGGDFNCVSDAADCVYPPGVAPPAHNSRLVGAVELSALMAEHTLVDVWRQQHGSERAHSHWSPSANSGARLDRWLLSGAGAVAFNVSCSIHAAAGIATDHLPVFLRLSAAGPGFPRGRGLRSFPLRLLNVPEACAELQDFLTSAAAPLLTGDTAQLVSRWDSFKADLLSRSWALYAQHRRARQQQARAADRAATQARHCLLHTTSPGLFTLWSVAARDASVAAVQAWQRLASPGLAAAAALEQHFGDSSSYYFHQQARTPHAPTVIKRLNRPGRAALADPAAADLSTVAGVGTAMSYCSQYYSAASDIGLFRARQDTCLQAQDALLASLPRRLGEAAASLAEGPDANGLLSAPELELALQMSQRGSVPGVDGLPYEVYRTFRSILVPVLVRVLNAAFSDLSTDSPLQPLLAGVLCLLPKSGQPADELSSYRPLTLLNCDVKLLMLVLSNRLQRPLDFVIGITQSAFLRGRDISDNVRYHLGLLSRLEELGLPGWLLHSDLTKAYDSVDRRWLLRAMHALGFRQAGVMRWCSLLLSGTRAQVRINGFLTAPFPVLGGLPQGGALSCTKWVIALEPLLSYLNELRAQGRLRSVELPGGALAPAAPAFADDTKTLLVDPDSDGPVVLAAFQLAARAGLPVQSVPKTKLLHLRGAVRPGLDAAAHTHHAATGYQLQPAGTPHRLLGVPYGSDEARCREAAYSGMVGSMQAATGPWAPLRLNLLGRAHVAMQCLASKFVYQANFRPPAPVLQAALQQALNRFVGTSSRAEEATPFQGQLFPRAAVSQLPSDRGGLGLPNVRAHVQAMQAKTAWLLFRFSSHPWHTLFAHEVVAACDAVSRCPPGVHCLVTDPARVRVDRLRTPLLCSAVTAFQQLGVERVLPLAEQSPWSVLLELTFHNAPAASHPALLPSQVASPDARQWHRLQDVRAAHLSRGSLAAAVLADLALVLAWLPAPWHAVVCSEAPPVTAWLALASDPLCSSARFTGPDPVTGVLRQWELWPSGRLHPAPDGLAPMLGPGLPLSVSLRPKPRTAWSRADYQFHQQQLARPAGEREELLEPWFVGVWPTMDLDPTVWGIRLPHGPTVCLLELEVRHARQRLAHLTRLAQLQTRTGSIPGYREAQAVWPRAWSLAPASAGDAAAPPVPPELRGLEGLEERWRHSAAEPVAPAGPSELLDWSPAWLDLAADSVPRAHPLARASARLEMVAAPPVLRPGFQQPWLRLADPTLHRPFRITCWRVLHGCLGCKAFLHHVRRQQHAAPAAVDVMCDAPECCAQPALETLSHAFLDCPAAAPAIDWLRDTWAQLTQQPPVPRSAQVLLADDLEAWPGHPTEAGALALWTRLRVAVLGAIWELRCFRPADGGSFARQAVSLALQHVLGALGRDWARTQGDVRHLDAGGFCMDWWRGVDTALTVAQFQQQWATPPLLCQVLGPGPPLPGSPDTRTLELLLRPGHPVPLPP